MSDLYTQLVESSEYLNCFKDTIVLGVAGKNGSGKDAFMELLNKEGFYTFLTGERLRKLGVASPLRSPRRGGNDSPSGLIGNGQRTRFPGGMLELGLIEWWSNVAHLPTNLRPKGLVVGSLRGTGEVARLKAIGGKLVVIDADPMIRYQRNASRRRADEIGLTFEQFCAEEEAELAVGQTDPTRFGMDAVLKQADITIYNNGPLESFRPTVVSALQKAGVSFAP